MRRRFRNSTRRTASLEQSLRRTDDSNADFLLGGGRSGSFFFFSGDEKFIFKTVSKGEASFLLSILPDMVSHVEKNQGEVLLARIHGLYSLKMWVVFVASDRGFANR